MQAPFQLSQADSRPMYLQIMEKVKQLVISGQWAAGHPMPSIREMAVAIGVSVITVKRAYQELEKEQVIYTRHGMGSFIAENTDIAMDQKRQELENCLSKSIELSQLLNLSQKELHTLLDELLAHGNNTNE